MLAESNADWLATCSIYEESSPTHVEPLLHGFVGCLLLTLSTKRTAFFRPIDEEGNFRYFELKQQPRIQLGFKYIAKTNLDEDKKDDDEEDSLYDNEELHSLISPTSVSFKWAYYPQEWPDDHKASFLLHLWEHSNNLLAEDPLSFNVVEYCEHQAIASYPPWTVFHQDNPYRMIRLPLQIDSLYHTNYGTAIHVQQEARKRGLMITRTASQISRTTKEDAPTSLMEYAFRALLQEWKKLYTTDCPICFDTMPYSDGVTLPCQDFVCEDCFESLLHFKIQELATYRTNPFTCPVDKCRKPLPIIGFVKHHLPKEEMDKIRRWIKDMKHPPCFSLDRCLSVNCDGIESIRRKKQGSTHIFCDSCEKEWCEKCLKRWVDDETVREHNEHCDDLMAWKFCKRYLAASDETKRKCESKFPWIISYAQSRQHDGDAVTWILQNGQVCPTCATGVERIAGCFHMQCPNCATHFCYECGDPLKPPYYGTHHCWERTQLQL